MLHSIGKAAISILGRFNAQNLTNTIWAYATVEVSYQPLQRAVAAEATVKIAGFTPQNLGNTAWAFSVLASFDSRLNDAISSQVRQKLEFFDLQAVTCLADVPLAEDVVQILKQRLLTEVDELWNKMLEEDFPDSFALWIKQLGVDNLGFYGDRLLFQRMGFKEASEEFELRALMMIAKHRIEDPREDPDEMTFGGPSKHKRVFSYAEYQISSPNGSLFQEGASLQENGARGRFYKETPLRAISLPINRRVDRTACSEFLLLTELCGLLQAVQDSRLDLTGLLRLFSTGPSCISCVAVLWQFHLQYPGLKIEVAYSKSTEEASPIDLDLKTRKISPN